MKSFYRPFFFLTLFTFLVSCQPPVNAISLSKNQDLPTSFIENGPLDQWVKRIDQAQLMTLSESMTPFLLYLGNPTCSSCLRFQPILTEWIETTKALVYYLDTLQQMNQLSTFQSEFPTYFPEGFSTPTLYLLSGNDRLHRLGASEAFFSIARFNALMRNYVLIEDQG